MGSQIAEYMLYALGGIGGLAWAIIIVRKWAPAARRRGGQWELEALLFIGGPVAATLVSLYPGGGASPGIFGNIVRALTDLCYLLSVIGIVRGLAWHRRKARGLIAAVLAYYLALIFSGIGGIVPGIPEAYWLAPLLVLAFTLNEGCTLEWFLRCARVAVRCVVVLSLLSMVLLPETAFNLDDARTFLGVRRLEGITPHPNMLGLVASIGFLLELQNRSKSRLIWRLSALAAVLLAQSSMAYLVIAIGALLLAGRLSKALRRILIVGIPIGALVAILDPGVSSSLNSFMSADELTRLLNGRTGIWDAALQGFYSNPIWGYGPSLLDADYRAIYLPYFSVASQAHNQWFQTLGESGIVGAVSLIALFLALVVNGVRGRAVSGGLSLTLPAALLIGSISETPLRPTGLSLGTFVVIIVLTVVVLARKTASQPATDDESEAGSRDETVLRNAEPVKRTTAARTA